MQDIEAFPVNLLTVHFVTLAELPTVQNHPLTLIYSSNKDEKNLKFNTSHKNGWKAAMENMSALDSRPNSTDDEFLEDK